MKIKLIRNEKQYKEALNRIHELMQGDIKEGSKESDKVAILSMLVRDYEIKNYSNPIEAIKNKMAQMNIAEAQLTDILGARSRKSEILSGKRKLSLNMIRQINKVMGIPADVLIQVY